MREPYLLFAGYSYYPSGGWHDFVEAFVSREKAIQFAKANCKNEDWWHVVDCLSKKEVATKWAVEKASE